MIYLASPYSHPDPAVRERRFRDACRATAKLLARGLHVFSPIVHGHAVALCGIPLPADYAYWRDYCRDFVARSSELFVLHLDGWRESVGVQDEILTAIKEELPIRDVSWPECRVSEWREEG